MGIPVNEQETTINFARDGKTASIYTSDSTVMTKLDKLAAQKDSSYRVVELHTLSGTVVAKTYECGSKRLISFRAGGRKSTMSEEQRKAAAERLRIAREKKS